VVQDVQRNECQSQSVPLFHVHDLMNREAHGKVIKAAYDD